MTQTKRTLAIASAFTLALLTGSAAAYANSKERIGIDNVDKCEPALRDPECTNDTAMGEDDGTVVRYGYLHDNDDYDVFFDAERSVKQDANEIRRRSNYLD